jgi:hypothetical protein
VLSSREVSVSPEVDNSMQSEIGLLSLTSGAEPDGLAMILWIVIGFEVRCLKENVCEPLKEKIVRAKILPSYCYTSDELK